jgi:beta-lactamase class A
MRYVLSVCLSLLLLCILSLSGLTLYQQHQAAVSHQHLQQLQARTNTLIKEKNPGPITTVLAASDSAQVKTRRIEEIIKSATKKSSGQMSVYYKNLTTNESVVVNGSQQYYMASLYKVVVTLYVLEREKEGSLSLSDKVGSPPLTLEKALTKIITESNNEYAVAIAEKYGWKNIGSFIKLRFGMDFSLGSDLHTDVTMMGSLFQIISEAIKLSDTESSYLLDLLHHQTRLTKLPKYLPKNIYSHNKTGELDQYSHDAGLFYTPKANYILIVMTKTPSPGVANEQMAVLSKDIYDVLNASL